MKIINGFIVTDKSSDGVKRLVGFRKEILKELYKNKYFIDLFKQFAGSGKCNFIDGNPLFLDLISLKQNNYLNDENLDTFITWCQDENLIDIQKLMENQLVDDFTFEEFNLETSMDAAYGMEDPDLMKHWGYDSNGKNKYRYSFENLPDLENIKSDIVDFNLHIRK